MPKSLTARRSRARRAAVAVVAAALGTLCLAVPADAKKKGDLSGQWEIQSMGADRNIVIEQKGKKLRAYRVLWPEFEGERYKLEHMYRGKVAGEKIKGQLLVKEDELPEFEVLRPFIGSVENTNQIILDGLPLRRVGTGSSIPTTKEQNERPSLPPSMG